MMRIVLIVGARPNFMKAAPLARELRARAGAHPLLVHTGQHYDQQMSQVFFDELRLPAPDVWLGTGGATHAEQTARIMVEFERVWPQLDPQVVVVCGDVNSTLACSIVSAKANVPVAHVEAGLRSFDRTMPEEINRLVTDTLASVLYTPSREAGENLRREGTPAERIVFVGNVMIDSLLDCVGRAAGSDVLERYAVVAGGYAVLTLHRPSNVDDAGTLAKLLDVVEGMPKQVKVVWPVHPRTAQRLAQFGLRARLEATPQLTTTPPLGYLDFIKLLSNAKLVLTDSGGIQEETTVLGIPCLTLRENTERPETIASGTNRLVGSDPERILREVHTIVAGASQQGHVPELWDGLAAGRIADDLLRRFWQ